MPRTNTERATRDTSKLSVLSLFSGIGGFDAGFARAGMNVEMLCESWEPARRVLREKFPDVPIADDIRTYQPNRHFDVITAGFPCVDLSHAGKQLGIFGPQTGLVRDVFRITALIEPEWLVLENVPNLLRLGRGTGIQFVTDSLEELGYRWAYRVLDSRAFGVAQRRKRVIILASRTHDVKRTLLDADVDASSLENLEPTASGFYWTEGRRGVGLVHSAVPTIKGGSTLGLPSAPAIWLPHSEPGRQFILPTIEDAEELQGFPRGWTSRANVSGELPSRWKLVGNAVTVGLAEWLGTRIVQESFATIDRNDVCADALHEQGKAWPNAAYLGADSRVYCSSASAFPALWRMKPLLSVVADSDVKALSFRATRGFLRRVRAAKIPLEPKFATALEKHLRTMSASSNESMATELLDSESSTHLDTMLAESATHGDKKRIPQEQELRRHLYASGLRYRRNQPLSPDFCWAPDISFHKPKVAVFVRPCAMAMCEVHANIKQAASSATSQSWRNNHSQFHDIREELTRQGWTVFEVNEHDDAQLIAADIAAQIRNRGVQGGDLDSIGVHRNRLDNA